MWRHWKPETEDVASYVFCQIVNKVTLSENWISSNLSSLHIYWFLISRITYTAQHGRARHGTALTARDDTIQHNTARQGAGQHGTAGHQFFSNPHININSLLSGHKICTQGWLLNKGSTAFQTCWPAVVLYNMVERSGSLKHKFILMKIPGA